MCALLKINRKFCTPVLTVFQDWNHLPIRLCYRCHGELSRSCVMNLSCDHFEQSCSDKGKVAPAALSPNEATKQTLPFWHFQNLSSLQNRIKPKNFEKIFLIRSSLHPPFFKKIAVRSSPVPAEIGFNPDLWSSLVGGCEIRKAMNVEPLLRIKRFQMRWFGHVPRLPRRDWRGKSCWLHPREGCPEVVQGPGGVTTSPTLLGAVLVWSQWKYLKLLLTVSYFES